MIARHHGHELDLPAMRRRFPDFSPTLRSLIRCAEAIDLHARPLRLNRSELRRLTLPAVLHWEFDHFVVATSAGRRGVVVNDPAAGRRRLGWNELDRGFTGVAVEFSRMPGFTRAVVRGLPTIRGLWRSFRGLRRYLALMLLLLVVSQLLALFPPIATQLLIDDVVLGHDRQWLHRVIGGLGVVMLSGLVIDSLRRHIGIYTGMQLSLETSSSIVHHLLNLPVPTVERRSVGDLVSRLDSVRPIQVAMTQTLLRIAVQGTVMLASCALMLAYSPTLAMVTITALSLVALIQALSLPRSRSLTMDALVASAAAKNSLIETLRGYASVTALGLSFKRLAHWEHRFGRATNANTRQQQIGLLAGVGQGLVNVFEHVFFLAVGLGGVLDKQLTLGVLFAFMSLRGRLQGAAAELVVASRDLYLARSHVERVGEIIAEQPLPKTARVAVRQALRGMVECVELSFAYPGRSDVLRRFDARIEPGESVAICGPSGAGKSTLLKLIAGLLEPGSGTILFDGIEAALWDRNALRVQIAVVLQADRLFEGSLADNISGFDPEPDIGLVRAAAQRAAVWADIQAMPMSLHTPVSGAGGSLSGGQVQRLLLARALYRRPRLLLLDEATSHLDQATEARVVANLAALDCTIISVTHRRNSIARAGRIICIDEPVAIET
jgi:ATP-binding cassette subfamily B protein RaxB